MEDIIHINVASKMLSKKNAIMQFSSCLDGCPQADVNKMDDDNYLLHCEITDQWYQFKGRINMFNKLGVPIGCPFIKEK